eukprot:m.138234 g.138234  ORF g.138234 m.138234 type:complete len:73 (+) comp14770_c0_seq7:2563-2781(+)
MFWLWLNVSQVLVWKGGTNLKTLVSKEDRVFLNFLAGLKLDLDLGDKEQDKEKADAATDKSRDGETKPEANV